jgi:PAS domain S-box-containing protein
VDKASATHYPDGYFLRLNAAWESTLGYTRDELKAKRLFDLVNPDDVRATQKAMVTKMSRA